MWRILVQAATLAVCIMALPAMADRPWDADDCRGGSMLATSDPAEVQEQYGQKVNAFVPVKVQVSNNLLDCADEIWIDAIWSNKIMFWGPGLDKKGLLVDSQYKQIKQKRGVWQIPLTERQTQLWVKLNHYSLFPSGFYFGKLRVSLVSDGDVIAEQFLDLTYYSEPKISIELDRTSKGKVKGTNGDYHIDLGELKSNARFDWGIKVLSNSAYDIVLDSEFDGLRHETNRQTKIDYTIEFDNVKIPSSEVLWMRYGFSNGVKNTWFGFSFQLGNVDLMPAGNYQDNLSLTIYPY